MPGVEAC